MSGKTCLRAETYINTASSDGVSTLTSYRRQGERERGKKDEGKRERGKKREDIIHVHTCIITQIYYKCIVQYVKHHKISMFKGNTQCAHTNVYKQIKTSNNHTHRCTCTVHSNKYTVQYSTWYIHASADYHKR